MSPFYELLALCCFFTVIFAQNATTQDAATQPGGNQLARANWGQQLNVPGAMSRWEQDFQDGFVLDLFSPDTRTVVVNQNNSPLDARYISGAYGESYVGIQSYSYVVQMSNSANNLIAKIQIPYDVNQLNRMGVQEGNTYVATLAQDKRSWVVDTTARNVHKTERNVRLVKMTNVTGEYRLVGRQSQDEGNIFVQYGQGVSRTLNISSGGRQEAEFIDGLRVSVVAQNNMNINVDLRNGIQRSALPRGMVPVNSYSWVMNSSNPTQGMDVSIRFPVNMGMVKSIDRPAREKSISVARRRLDAGSNAQYEMVVAARHIRDLPKSGVSKVTLDGVRRIDGEYILVAVPANMQLASPW